MLLMDAIPVVNLQKHFLTVLNHVKAVSDFLSQVKHIPAYMVCRYKSQELKKALTTGHGRAELLFMEQSMWATIILKKIRLLVEVMDAPQFQQLREMQSLIQLKKAAAC